MSTRIVLDLPDKVYRRLESLARRSQRSVNDLVAEAVAQSVPSFPIDPHREAMMREVAAYKRLHPTLRHDYLGQYVAIAGGELVDHDPDAVALLRRVRLTYPDRTVLRRKVESEDETILYFRSPRLSLTRE